MISGEQIKREVSVMKMVRHTNVVRLHEVLASRTKIYIILELASGGELFDRIVRRFPSSFFPGRDYFFLSKRLHVLQFWA